MKKQPSTLHKNKKAFHDYEMIESYEAGIQLLGPEVKSIRAGNCNLKGAYVVIRGEEMYVVGMHVSRYPFSQEEFGPTRDRKVFLHRRTIQKLELKSKEARLTLIPTRIYLKNNRIKIEVALARGKRLYDKKQTLKNRDQEREKQREASRYFP